MLGTLGNGHMDCHRSGPSDRTQVTGPEARGRPRLERGRRDGGAEPASGGLATCPLKDMFLESDSHGNPLGV